MWAFTQGMVLTLSLTQLGYITIPWIKWVMFPFWIVRPHIYSILGYKYLEGTLPVVLASLIEGHCRTYILLLFVIGFNPSNIYVLLYSAPTYGDISTCRYLGYWIRACVRLLILIRFFVACQYFILYYIVLGFSRGSIYHPQTTKTVQPRFYQKLINYNSDLIYCFRTTRRCRVLIYSLPRFQQVFSILVKSKVLKKKKHSHNFWFKWSN